MKALLRLALLTLCGAAGILIAVQVAASRSTEADVDSVAVAPLPAVSSESSDEAAPEATSPPPTAVSFKPLKPHRRPLPQPESDDDIEPTLEADVPQPRTAQQIALPDGASLEQAVNILSTMPQENFDALRQSLLQQMQQPPGEGGPVIAPADSEMMLLAKDLLQRTGNGKASQAEQIQGLLGLMSQVQQRKEATAAPLVNPIRGEGANAGFAEAPATSNATAVQAPAAPPLPEPPPAAPAPVVEAIPSPPAVEREGDLISVHTKDDDVRNVLEGLAQQAGLNVLASESVAGKITVNLTKVTIEDAFSAVLKATGFVSRREGNVMYIGTTADFAALERSLDRIGTRVFRPNYLNAKELQQLLTPLITPNVGKISVTSPASVGIAVDNTAAGGDSISQQDAVVVQDYESVLSQIDQIYRELDQRPAQVSIEAVIVSVALDDESRFGVDFQVLRDKEHVRFGWGSPTQTLSDTFSGGLKFAFLDSSLGVFLNALETIGDANVIASPKLLCLNKQKAEILIGQRLGYISTTVTQNFSTQNVEFLDVGAQLRLRPFISSDGLIRMEVHPELSEGEVVVADGFTLPNKTLTEVTTNVMCPNGCTVIIGGLMRENLRSNTTQVPLLGSLPLAGPLFRNKTENVERTEILVLLTPRIVEQDELAAEGAEAKKDSYDIEGAKFHRMSPVSRVHLSRDYLIRAQSALARGDRGLAQRFARLAVHYDPLNRPAVKFYHDLGGPVKHGGRPSTVVSQGWGVETHVGEDAPLPASVDGETVPQWMLNELGEPTPPPMPQYPRDPGVSGRDVDIVRPEIFGNDQP